MSHLILCEQQLLETILIAPFGTTHIIVLLGVEGLVGIQKLKVGRWRDVKVTLRFDSIAGGQVADSRVELHAHGSRVLAQLVRHVHVSQEVLCGALKCVIRPCSEPAYTAPC